MLRRGYKIAAPAATLILVCFFISWASVSCAGQSMVEVSGWDIATGPKIEALFGTERADANPALFFVPLVSLAVLSLAFWAWRRGSLTLLDQAGLLALGVLPLLILWVGFANARQDAAASGFSMDYRIGWWGSILGFLGIAAGGVWNWFKGSEPALPPSGETSYRRFSALLPSMRARGDPREPATSPPAYTVPVTQGAPEPQVERPGTAARTLVSLTVLEGPLTVRHLSVETHDVLIGRGSDCDIQLPDPTASRRHARLRYAQSQWFLQDQGSGAGTFVNGKPIIAGQLNTGDLIEIGESTFRFETLE